MARVMGKMLSPFEVLKDNQASASVPVENVWLSASAGTGKTHVLAARVFRLLLQDVKPESILCLTFTKAGAAEMAERINKRLASWVRLPANALRKDLHALGERNDDVMVDRARQLFARVLDARGGGLRIQTIHSFCQTMLGAFPAEIGLTPGFRAMDAREQGALAARVLGDMVIAAEAEGRLGLLDNLRISVLRLGEDMVRKFLSACAGAGESLEALGPAIDAGVRTSLGLPLDDVRPLILAGCSDGGYPIADLTALRDLNAAWGTTRALPRVEKINHWLAISKEARMAGLNELASVWTKGDGGIFSSTGWIPKDDEYLDISERLFTHFNALIEIGNLDKLATEIAAALSVGRDYARAYADAKRAEGLVDFDDLIAKTVALLGQEGIGQWIKYKLDQSTDHVLIDEAQDTNANQWKIVDAITDDFFSGDGQKSVTRTVFTVGDYKQAIFGFQGTNPKEFAAAKTRLMARARDAGREVADLSLNESFRSSQPILDVVDSVINHVGAKEFGLARADPRHLSAMRGCGAVTLWSPVGDRSEADEDASGDDDSGPEDWITPGDRMFADKLAKDIKGWLDNPRFVECKDRPLRPEDIMILLRSRRDMARLIVARLHGEGVPVAGLDRLRLNAPLAVQDLLACVRFVLQPGDNLNLAALLVSPIIGWNQQQLYDHSFGRSMPLWDHIRSEAPAPLHEMLKIADQVTPYRFFETILSGVIDARRKLIARMGAEIRDPVEELLNAALAFEGEATASLQQFLDWFDRGDVDVARNLSEPDNAVRVMTVHGAKGLQAPIIILADATFDPKPHSGPKLIHWTIDEDITVPIFKPRKEEIVAPLQQASDEGDATEREEHWRLLYVAMTRAEEHLYVGGALSKKQASNGALSPDCWHSAVAMALGHLGAETADDAAVTFARNDATIRRFSARTKAEVNALVATPAWLRLPAPQEARPPRPLAPSSLGRDDVIQPPPAAIMRKAAQRGRWLHSLFERLPDVAPSDRLAAGLRWLEQAGGVDDPVMRAELMHDALAVIEHPDFAPLFEGDALAEAPLAGVVAGLVIAGTVDRLIVTQSRVTVIDYKTGSRIPRDVTMVPRSHLRQMSAYAALLASIFPEHEVCAGLLYTAGPVLHMLDKTMIDAHKPPYDDAN
jgi:ATP-dependent helicase/nuclease subunit A